MYDSLSDENRHGLPIDPNPHTGVAAVAPCGGELAAAAKVRGVTLGNPKLHTARSSAVSAVKAEAERYAANVLPVIREAQKAGRNHAAGHCEGTERPRGRDGSRGSMARQVRQQHS